MFVTMQMTAYKFVESFEPLNSLSVYRPLQPQSSFWTRTLWRVWVHGRYRTRRWPPARWTTHSSHRLDCRSTHTGQLQRVPACSRAGVWNTWSPPPWAEFEGPSVEEELKEQKTGIGISGNNNNRQHGYVNDDYSNDCNNYPFIHPFIHSFNHSFIN